MLCAFSFVVVVFCTLYDSFYFIKAYHGSSAENHHASTNRTTASTRIYTKYRKEYTLNKKTKWKEEEWERKKRIYLNMKNSGGLLSYKTWKSECANTNYTLCFI